MRTIDGRRCWFEGHLWQDKNLFWPNGVEEIVPMTVSRELAPVAVLYADSESRFDQVWQDLAAAGQWRP